MSHTRLSLLPLAALLVAACSSKDSADDAAPATAVATTEAPLAASPAGEPTAVDISNYKLDMDKMKKLVGVLKTVSTMKPSGADSAAMENVNMGSEPVSVTIGKIESVEPMKRALASNGLNARDYVMIMAAYLQAGMTGAMLESNPQAKLPEGQNRQNIDFVRNNRAELERMMKEAGMQQ